MKFCSMYDVDTDSNDVICLHIYYQITEEQLHLLISGVETFLPRHGLTMAKIVVGVN